MKKRKKGLGKGLEALIPAQEMADAFAKTPTDIKTVSIGQVKANVNQPRKNFDQEEIRSLANTVKEYGILEPLIVERDGGGYSIISGERRYRAAIIAGLSEIPVIIKSLSDREKAAIALIENIQRKDLNDLEKAQAYNSLKEEYEMTQSEIAATLGTSRAAVANTLRILSLSEAAKEKIISGEITAGHARAILSVDEKYRDEFLERIIREELSVRKSEAAAKEYSKEKKSKPRRKTVRETDPYIKDIEERMALKLGTKVTIKEGANSRGKIILDYYSNEELTRLIELFDLED